MAFLNNPLIASLAGSVGLGHLVPGADPAVNPSPTPKGSAPNQPEYKQARFFDPRSPQGARGGNPTTGMPTEPGALSPDVQNNPTVMDLLNHFGVHPTQQIDPGLFIHNANAWQNHPVMSGVLDGLLGGLANTKGGDTIGENLSNVAQGLAATHAQQTAHVNAQLMAPYQQAMTVANLQNEASKQAYQQSEQHRADSQAGMYDNLLTSRESIAQTNADAKVKAAQVHTQGQVAIANARPQNIDTQTWTAAVQKRMGALLADGHEATADDYAAAKLGALQDVGTAKEAPKAAGQIKVADAALPGKIKLKQTMSGGSATASTNKPGTLDPQAKAAIAAKEQDIRAYDSATFIVGDPSKGEPPLITKNMPQYAARRQKLVSERDALINGSGSAPTSKYSSNNPFAK